MQQLHLHDDNESVPAPLPFPVDLVTGQAASDAMGGVGGGIGSGGVTGMDSIANAEEALERAQLSMDKFKAMFGPVEPNDDGPRAA